MLPSTVFKTAAFDHSAIPPYIILTFIFTIPYWDGQYLCIDRAGFLWFREPEKYEMQLVLFQLERERKMKQKYTIIKDSKNKQLIIREFAELDKEILSLLCEETYEQKMIMAAIKSGKEHLISALRTNNLYPPGIYAEKIADAVKELYTTRGKESEDLFFDDLELLTRTSEPKPRPVSEPADEQDEEIDDVIEEDFDSDFDDDEDQLKNLDSSLKIADDEYGDTNDES